MQVNPLILFEDIVNELYTDVFSYCYAILKDRVSTEDVCQEVFLKVREKIDILDLKKSYKSWIITIARNTCMDYFRQQKREKRSDFQVEWVIDHKTNPEQKSVDQEKKSTLLHCLNMLKDEFRIILVLRDIDALSYQDIADHLNIDKKRVKWILHKARIQLKDLVEEQYA